MERAGKLLGQSKAVSRCLTPEQLILASWQVAVGKKIAVRTRARKLVRERLVIEVDDAIWQKQLYSLRTQILSRFDTVLGPGYVSELEFKVVPMKRGPAMETRTVRDGGQNEADRIEDPILSRIYKASERAAKRKTA